MRGGDLEKRDIALYHNTKECIENCKDIEYHKTFIRRKMAETTTIKCGDRITVHLSVNIDGNTLIKEESGWITILEDLNEQLSQVTLNMSEKSGSDAESKLVKGAILTVNWTYGGEFDYITATLIGKITDWVRTTNALTKIYLSLEA